MTNDARLRLGQLLNSFLPDWASLERQSADAKRQEAPIGMAHWTSLPALNTKSHLAKGLKCDVWLIPEGICLYKKPGLLERLLGALAAMLAAVLMPLLKLWKRFEQHFQQFALRLGPLSFVITLPFALIGLVWDFFTVWVRELFLAVLNPFALVAHLLTFPLWLLRTLISRSLSTLISAWVDRMTDSLEQLAAELIRRRWIRGIVLGCLRRNRPAYPIIVPRELVTQVILTTKWGLFGKSEYLVVVEGDALEAGFNARILSFIKRLFLPFYWERTIHVLGAVKRQQGHIFQALTAALNKKELSWEDRFSAADTSAGGVPTFSMPPTNANSMQPADSTVRTTSPDPVSQISPGPSSSVPSVQTIIPAVDIGAVTGTDSTLMPQPTSFFKSKPFLLLVTAAVVVCGGVALHKSLAEKTTLLFDFSLDGKQLPADKAPNVKVDGQPFISGSRVVLWRHRITVELENAEPFEGHYWVFYGAKNLGVLPLESSKGSLVVTVNPTPATVVLKHNGETVHRGDAPLSIEKLMVGEYTLAIQRGDYAEDHSIKIQRRHRTEAKIDLNLGGVHLSSDPADAEFQLSGNGRQWDGKLPTLIDDVPVGDYRFTARRKGWELSADVLVSRGGIATNKTEFQYGSISVTSNPTGLVISTNGVEIGKTPTVLHELKPGQYSLTATDGENDLTAEISVGTKEDKKHAFVFRYGAAQLSSIPPGATVIRKGKEVGKTPMSLNHIPIGESSIELRLDGYVSTNLIISASEGTLANFSVKLISEQYLQAMKHAREALDAAQFSESQKFLTNALESEPNDSAALKLRDEVFQAAAKAADALRTEQAKKKADELASLTWLDFNKVISDCTDTKQVQYPVVLEDGYYQNYVDDNGKRKTRFIKTGQHTEMRTRTESTFNPRKFSENYEGRRFGFNCPDKWSVSKIEKEGGIILKVGRGLLGSDEIRATAPTSNRDALKSLHKGQKVTIKAVLKTYKEGAFVRTLYLEDAEMLDK